MPGAREEDVAPDELFRAVNHEAGTLCSALTSPRSSGSMMTARASGWDLLFSGGIARLL